MKSDFCQFEETRTTALAEREWNEQLAQHAATCCHCADLLLVSQFLATAPEPTAPLPAPGLIWWRSQLAERREHAARAVAAIDLMQKLAICVALIVVAAAALVWHPMEWNVVGLGAALLISTSIVLYSWVRGRI